MCEGEDTLRLGVLGGTFDPPHYGHLALAETARVQLGLDCVLFVPSGHPPHKSKCPLTPAHQRVALVEVAIADNSAFALSRVDLDRPGLHYTVEMLALLRREYPAAEVQGVRKRRGVSRPDTHEIVTHRPAFSIEQNCFCFSR